MAMKRRGRRDPESAKVETRPPFLSTSHSLGIHFPPLDYLMGQKAQATVGPKSKSL